jgi:hypothetical protein
MAAARYKIANKERVTLAQAALCHGTSVDYLEAAIVVLKTNDQALIDRVERGDVSLKPLARLLKPAVRLMEALANTTSAQKTAASRAHGNPDQLWTDMIEPLLEAAE